MKVPTLDGRASGTVVMNSIRLGRAVQNQPQHVDENDSMLSADAQVPVGVVGGGHGGRGFGGGVISFV